MLRKLFPAGIQALFLLAWCHLAVAQSNITGSGIFGDAKKTSATYQGPGDIVSGARAWYGLRAYSAAKAGNPAINLCDNAGANCADISTNATTGNLNNPGTLGANNCSTSGTCQIKTFYDQTQGNGCSSASCDVTNVTAAARPTLLFSCFNSLPCAVFVPSQQLVGPNSIASGTAQATFAAVGKRTSAFTAFAGLLSVGTAGLAWNSSANQAMLFNGSIAGFTASDSVVHSLIGVFNSASSIGYTDDVPTSSLSPGSAAIQGVPSLGQVNGGNNLTGDIFEAGFWGPSINFTSGQVTSMCHNQFSYWGTATSC